MKYMKAKTGMVKKVTKYNGCKGWLWRIGTKIDTIYRSYANGVVVELQEESNAWWRANERSTDWVLWCGVVVVIRRAQNAGWWRVRQLRRSMYGLQHSTSSSSSSLKTSSSMIDLVIDLVHGHAMHGTPRQLGKPLSQRYTPSSASEASMSCTIQPASNFLTLQGPTVSVIYSCF